MTENTGFAAYALFNAIKLHFTGSYDYFKYHGKTNVTKDHFAKNKGKYQFYKLARRYNLEEIKGFYVANFIKEDINWVGELMTPEAESNYKKWQKRNQALTHTFEDDIIKCMEQRANLDDLLRVKGNNLPELLHGLMSHNISIETICILDDILGFLPMWNKKIYDDVVWPSWRNKIEKYKPFIDYDRTKFKAILKELMNEYAEA